MNVVAVAVGGALGSLARWGIGEWVQTRAGLAFPWGTLGVNALGSLLIGVAWGIFEASAPGDTLRLFMTIGFLGAFTTFSTFSHETVLLLQQGQTLRAAAYVGGSVGIGVALAFVGIGLGLWVGRGAAA